MRRAEFALPLKIKFIAGFFAALAVFIGLALLLNAYNYSVGSRTGLIDKLSVTGLLCWTTEGQLALPNFSRPDSLAKKNAGAIDNTFYFSVPDKDVRKQIEAIPRGSAVSLQYHQKMFALSLPLPLLCRRRTDYEIVGVTLAPNLERGADEPVRP